MYRRSSSVWLFLILYVAFGSWSCKGQDEDGGDASLQKVKVGAEVLMEEHLDTLEKHRIGLVANPTARVDGVHLLDTLRALDIPVKALYAPEHGFRGRAAAGEKLEDGIDQQSGLPIYSLYGDTRKPAPHMLENVDLLLFDIQDVGARFYTYHATLGKVIEAAASQNIPVWVLDRPNPAGGKYVSGWVLEDQFRSFVGEYPIPVVHGMTMGELARMMVGEGWITNSDLADIRVIKMKGWERDMVWPETGLAWVPPSPNLPRFENAYFYLGTAFFEGTGLSEGRGTDDPFLKVGGPQTELPDSVIERLEQHKPVNLEKMSFVPRSIPGKANHPEFEGKKVNGVSISLTGQASAVDPLVFGLKLLKNVIRHTPDVNLNDHLYRLAGTETIGNYLKGHLDTPLSNTWREDIEAFKKRRKPYLLYPSNAERKKE